MSNFKRILLAFLVLSASTAFAYLPQNRRPDERKDRTEKLLAAMTLDEKIGQLIVPATVGMFLNQESDSFQEIRRNIKEFHVGGYHLLGDTSTLHEPVGVALLVNRMQEAAKVPLFITADFEGGVGWRFRGATRLPRAMAMGATSNPEMAYQAGRVTALEARALGVNVNFYPVVDVNNNASNPVINIRSFGGDPERVSEMARAYIRGSQEAGVMATAKHFPGHGDTSVDSHLELPVIDVDRKRLDAVELPPFRAAVAEGVGGVMSAHIALPRIETENLPATLSEKMLTGVLREELRFEGVIFTDAMAMRGIAAHFTEEEAAVRAVKAGADVVLYPPSVEKAFFALKRAVASGLITEARIDESVRRILAAKLRLRLDSNRFAEIDKLDRILGNTEHRRVARQIIETAITLVRDKRGVLPLKLTAEQKVLYITLVDSGTNWRENAPGSAFHARLTERHAATTSVYVSDRTSPGEYELIRKLAALADVVIVGAFIRTSAYKGSIGLSQSQIDLLRHLSALEKPFVLVLYGSPYLLSFVPELPVYILAYEYYPAAEEAALAAVLGEIEFKGRLPVELPGFYEIGHRAAGARPASGTK
ncbi:MAG: hypothetical protein L0229_19015 [Blastocatellia bacterium]|nr:hypothetical protein [Blastocatellia bacterium]